jgi:sugar lactone lactonase YvrE
MSSNQLNLCLRRSIVVGASVLLGACGGGGGGGNSSFLPIVPVAPELPAVVSFKVGGSVTGLVGTLVLQNNGGDDLKLMADGRFTFTTPVTKDAAYDVKVRSQPLWQFCTVTKGNGTPTADVGDVAVTCSAALAEVSTLAGAGTPGWSDGDATAALFSSPVGIAFDQNGALLVSDQGSGRLRRIAADGDVSTFAGDGVNASVDGNGLAASFSTLSGIALAPSGDVYAAEFGAHRVRKISPSADVTTFAGSGVSGTVDGNGISARFNSPQSVAVDSTGLIYVIENGGHVLRRITPAGDVSTLAGSGVSGFADGAGAAAEFDQPTGVAVDSAGNAFVADCGNNRIRKVTSAGVVTTFAGSGAGGAADGDSSSASFSCPGGVAIDTDGNLYVADAGNSLLRRISPTGVVSTLAGQSGVNGAQNGIGAAATFTNPFGVVVGADGTVYVADTFNHLVRKVKPIQAP